MVVVVVCYLELMLCTVSMHLTRCLLLTRCVSFFFLCFFLKFFVFEAAIYANEDVYIIINGHHVVEESGELLYMQRSVLSRFCLFAVRNELLLVLKGYWHKSEECLSYNIILLILHPFNGLFSTTTWVGQYQEGKTSLDLNEARDDGVWGCSDISWTICKQSAPRSSQITTPTTRHRIFAGRVHSCRPANGVKALNNFLSSCR